MALKTRRYDLRGNYRGPKVTYAACTTAKSVAVSGTAAFSILAASATKTIRLQKVIFSGVVATAANYVDVVLRKTSTVATGGTPVTLTQTPYVSSSAAGTAAACNFYTAAPTSGTLVGTLGVQTVFGPLLGTPAVSILPVTFDYTTESEQETPTLTAGSTQSFELNFGTAPGNAVTCTVQWIWTEE